MLVLRKAEKLRELDANLLPGLLRLRELVGGLESINGVNGLNVCVVLLSCVAADRFHVAQGLVRCDQNSYCYLAKNSKRFQPTFKSLKQDLDYCKDSEAKVTHSTEST